MATKNENSEISELKGDVRVLTSELQSSQNETNRRLGRIEEKIDAQTSVPLAAFEEYKKDAKSTYASKEELRPIKALFWSIISALTLGVAGLVFKVIERQFK